MTERRPLYLPRTPRDFSVIDRLVLSGATDQEIFRVLRSPFWRSECEKLERTLICRHCRQEVIWEFCEECGLPYPPRPLLSPG